MRIEELLLVDYRNYERVELRLAPGLNVITGANGQGKTNLLEAVHVLGGRTPPRFGGNPRLVRYGCSRAVAEALVKTGGAEARLRLDVSPGSRQLFANGKRTRAMAAGPLVTAMFCPETLCLIKEGASARRELLDDLIERLRPAYRQTRADYARVVRQRNKILQGPHSGNAQLAAWDEQLAQLGAEVVVRRRALVERIEPMVSGAYATLAGEATGAANARYETRLLAEGDDTAAVAREIHSQLAQRRDDELARGITLIGPHRDDLAIELDGHGLRGFGSQGEQRTAALALVLAEAQILKETTGESPVLLLDDVLSELDGNRRQQLLGHLGSGSQALVTITNESAMGELAASAHWIRVSGGRIEAG